MRKAWYQTLDWGVIAAWALLVTIGLAAIYSSTHGPGSKFLLDTVKQNFDRQLIWSGVCVVVMIVTLLVRVRFIQKMALIAYAITICLTLAALLFGREINGAKSWISLGGYNLQSSELAKVGLLLAVAQVYSIGSESRLVGKSIVALLMIIVPAVIVVLQNDTGTALVFLAMIPFILYWSGVPLVYMMILVSPAVAGYLAITYLPGAIVFTLIVTAIAWFGTKNVWAPAAAAVLSGGVVAALTLAVTKILQPHQVARLVSFVDPEKFRFDEGYQIIQARAAVGSGGLLGKGFTQGTQTQMAFVPEQSTDFIFAVVGEEFGFVGTLIVLALFGYIMVKVILMGIRIRHPFALIFAAGMVGVFFVHIFFNIGMNVAIMPVIGIPLPFVSYGGSALLANTTLLAIMLNLYMRREEFPRFGYT